MVFCGIYPADGAKYPDLKDALEKLQLNDASLTFELETSAALGFGFRCGFLGLLHMEIITERLEREFDLDIITTTPSVRYRLTLTDGTVEMIDNPSSYPDPSNIVKQEEPFVDVHLYTPNDYVLSLIHIWQSLPVLTQLHGLGQAADGQTDRALLGKDAGTLHGTVAVAVGLDHRTQRQGTGPGLDGPEVMTQGVQIDLGPDVFFKRLSLHDSFFLVCNCKAAASAVDGTPAVDAALLQGVQGLLPEGVVGAAAVSYTHLDVYKRQVWSRSESEFEKGVKLHIMGPKPGDLPMVRLKWK